MNSLPSSDGSTRAVAAAVLCGVLAGMTVLVSAAVAAADRPAEPAFLVRDRTLELPTPYVPPPGNPLEHHAAGFAQIMCSAVFITGLDAGFAAENVGYFTAPYAVRAKLGKPVIDRNSKTVSVAVPDGTTRVAKYLGDQGCVTFEPGQSAPKYEPHAVPSRLPDPATQAWPDGDALPVAAAAAAAGVELELLDEEQAVAARPARAMAENARSFFRLRFNVYPSIPIVSMGN